MGEPTVTYATIREAIDPDRIVEFHIECRFSDGQKFAAVIVDAVTRSHQSAHQAPQALPIRHCGDMCGVDRNCEESEMKAQTVDAVMRLVEDYVRLRTNGEREHARKRPSVASAQFAAAANRLAELRASLSACVAEWKSVDEYPNDCRAVLGKWAPISGTSDAGFVYAVTRKIGYTWINAKNPEEHYCAPDAFQELEGAEAYTPTYELNYIYPPTTETETEGETK